MAFDSDHLLKRLQPVVRPCGPNFQPRTDTGSFGSDFTQFIELAAQGELTSGRPVTHPPSAELTMEQRAQLSRACDALESAGIERGGVLVHERMFLVDVPGRSVLHELGPEDAGAVQKLGGIVAVQASAEPHEATSDVSRLARQAAIPAVPPGVLAQLERGSGASGAE